MKKVIYAVVLFVLTFGSVLGQFTSPEDMAGGVAAPSGQGGVNEGTQVGSNQETSAATDNNSNNGTELGDLDSSGPGLCGGTKNQDREYIILNTDVPFIGRCIKKTFNEGDGETNVSNVFPRLMGNLIRIMMTILVVGGFLGILVGGFMIASNGAFGTKQTGVKLIVGVIAGLALLGASGIILNLINPTFFGTAS